MKVVLPFKFQNSAAMMAVMADVLRDESTVTKMTATTVAKMTATTVARMVGQTAVMI